MPNYEMIIPAILEHGIKELPDHCKLTPGIPVKPMLAHPTKSISEVLNRFENTPFTCEYKYDGERAQIHRDENGKIKIFSRNAEDSTPKYPDVLEQVENFTKPDTTTFILDCEAVAWDSETQEILPFNILTTRKRKDVQVKDIKVKVCLFAFDLLNLNGKSLLRTPLEDRRKLLFEHFQEVAGVFTFAKSMVSEDVEEISEFLDQSIKDKCEGLMVKVLQNEESSYEPSKRSRNWLKVKKDYMNTIGDTLDLVVIGAYYGKGKRANTYGKYLLACYNPKDESYQSICKIGTGFTDADLLSHYEELQPHIISKPRSDYSFSSEKSPDIWFSPNLVWEIKAADLSISPIYKAGIGEVDDTKGISLRFPRFLKNREKKPEDASETSLVVDMYKNQSILQPNSNGQAFADDDFEY
jgi:DNA ligase-1